MGGEKIKSGPRANLRERVKFKDHFSQELVAEAIY
jgi:hypothetical protein